jgi:hypothetical protein
MAPVQRLVDSGRPQSDVLRERCVEVGGEPKGEQKKDLEGKRVAWTV